MEVQIKLEDWKIELDKENNIPEIKGHYKVMCGETEIAKQSFNEGYNSTKVPFTGDLIKSIMNLELNILEEIQGLLK